LGLLHQLCLRPRLRPVSQALLALPVLVHLSLQLRPVDRADKSHKNTVYKADCGVDWFDCMVDCMFVGNVGNPTSHDGMTFFFSFAKGFLKKVNTFFCVYTKN
jgi:hypothetical protein